MNSSQFHVALRAAITASGLPLDRIRYRLELRDVSVSVPTLSNWQSGRRRPERAESLRALTELENVLELPPAALRSLLGPPRPRGRSVRQPSLRALTSLWGDTELLSTVDIQSDDKLVRLSHHDTIRVTGGRLTRAATRQVLRAGQDGADRWILVWGNGPAEVVAVRHCRLGRLSCDGGLTVAELIFDAPLTRGETTIIEYRVESDGGEGFAQRFHRPTRDYVLEAIFDELPARCMEIGSGRILTPRPSGSTHLVGLNITGEIGITWEMR
jgi:hypothetical protein